MIKRCLIKDSRKPGRACARLIRAGRFDAGCGFAAAGLRL